MEYFELKYSLSIASAFERLTTKSSMIMLNGKAVISVIVCNAWSPPTLRSNKARSASNPPKVIFCHLGEFFASRLAILSITSIPESAEVTKKIIITRMTMVLIISVKGRYFKNSKVNASGLEASIPRAPSAILKSNQMALFPKTDIQIILNSVGNKRTAAINSWIVLPFEMRAINNPTNGDHEIHHAQYKIVQL